METAPIRKTTTFVTCSKCCDLLWWWEELRCSQCEWGGCATLLCVLRFGKPHWKSAGCFSVHYLSPTNSPGASTWWRLKKKSVNVKEKSFSASRVISFCRGNPGGCVGGTCKNIYLVFCWTIYSFNDGTGSFFGAYATLQHLIFSPEPCIDDPSFRKQCCQWDYSLDYNPKPLYHNLKQ